MKWFEKVASGLQKAWRIVGPYVPIKRKRSNTARDAVERWERELEREQVDANKD